MSTTELIIRTMFMVMWNAIDTMVADPNKEGREYLDPMVTWPLKRVSKFKMKDGRKGIAFPLCDGENSLVVFQRYSDVDTVFVACGMRYTFPTQLNELHMDLLEQVRLNGKLTTAELETFLDRTTEMMWGEGKAAKEIKEDYKKNVRKEMAQNKWV